jgi:aspartate carbamoyltransferase regulatory subunit
MADNANPLSKSFRQPAVQLKLPSDGKYWRDGDVNIPVTGELPIYPMRVSDEITLKTPDALANGSAVVELIHNCVPTIKNAWNAPITDIDALLIAIRIASYGIEMDVTIECPSCKSENDFAIDLRTVLQRIKTANFSSPDIFDDLKITFKPQTYRESNSNDIVQFEQDRLVKALLDADLPQEEKARIMKESVKKITAFAVQNIANHIDTVTTADGTRVTDKAHITEFLMNCSRATYKGLQQKIKDLNDASILKPLHVQCKHCDHEFDSALVFNYSRFFG